MTLQRRIRDWYSGRRILYGMAVLMMLGAIGPCGHKNCERQCGKDASSAFCGFFAGIFDCTGDLFSAD